MLYNYIVNFGYWATIIDFLGALLIVAYIVRACLILIIRRDIRLARLIVADGIIVALTFTLAGTLLRTIELQTWRQILMFAAIFALRTFLKKAFVWERMHLQRYM